MNLFLYTNKIYNTSLDQIMQRTNNKHNNKILTIILYLLNFNVCWMLKKNIHGNYIKFLYCSK